LELNLRVEKTESLIASARQLDARLRADPHRPTYHFTAPMGWMNDINGAIFWRGRYHIFYQHNPEGGYWKWMQWGHASSVDLVHWVDHPIALTPDLDGPDRDGCFSGGAFLSKEGLPTFVYYGVPDGECIATSTDDLLINWTKHPDNPVIPQPKEGNADYGKYTVQDPCVWLDGDTYYCAINRRQPQGQGDLAYLFKSTDLGDWEYVGPFYESSRKWTEADEDCAVPNVFPIVDGKHMLVFTSHLIGSQYYIGHIENEKFQPEIHGRLSWYGGQLGGGRTLQDDSGRRIFFDWLRELRGEDKERASGWSGVMTVPRVFSLTEDGTLAIEPVPELQALRYNHREREGVQLAPDSEIVLDEIQGDALELAIEIAPTSAQTYGIKVRCSPNGAEQTAILYDPTAKLLKIDVSKSSLDEEIKYTYYRSTPTGLSALSKLPMAEKYVESQDAPFDLADGEPLILKIFIDRSVLEVFANGRQCITQRIYPTRADSLGVRLFATGGDVEVRSIEAWDMAPTR